MTKPEKSISETMRGQYNDLIGLYDEALQIENAPLMEKLAKSTSTLAKQIQVQELHERETLKRDDARRLAKIMGRMMANSVLHYFPDDDRAELVIDQIFDELILLAEDKDL
jgi:uncharacterized membrane-anchored protein YjiN (DUF445 family)